MNTFKIKWEVEEEVERGYGVYFETIWSVYLNEETGEMFETGMVSDIKGHIVEINEDTVIAGTDVSVVVETDDGWSDDIVPVSQFERVNVEFHHVANCGDTHDLRSKFFENREDAEKYLEFVVNRFYNPKPWESFVQV